ncbi:MAG TPA: anthranilate phosphoribosyltransferase, partial [Legionella sp.]|nr:anthranilate phosphoribosyltransferase [Legionella sp.]
MLKDSLQQLMKGHDLDRAACQNALTSMLAEDANPVQTAAFLALLHAKHETADELMSLVLACKQRMLPVPTPHRVMDIVGTGGDGAHTINISTGSAILAASCGVKLVKHGNRAVSSLAGSADVLEALGVAIDLTVEQIMASVDQIGIGFCFGPQFHPAMRALRTVRQQLSIPTTFNILGPLLNPANPAHYLLGVFNETLLRPVAQSLQQLGTQRSVVAHGCLLDEISCIGPTKIIEINQTDLHEYTIKPGQFGLKQCNMADLRGGNAQTNAQILWEVFSNGLHHRQIADT